MVITYSADTVIKSRYRNHEMTMPARTGLSISKRTVDALAVETSDAVFWDRDLPGFGVRVYPSGRKVYVAQARAHSAPRRVTLGQHGDITADQARKHAAVVIDRIKKGEDPTASTAQSELTVLDLAGRYMTGHVAQNCNTHTAGIYRGSLKNHILPALGAKPVAAVDGGHISALHYQMRHTPRAANRALMILSKMFNLATVWGMLPEGTNPCRGVRKYKERKRERFLTMDEYRRLGAALTEAEAAGTVSCHAVAAFRLLMLTGCRLTEILTLRWDDVDRTAGELRLRDGKTGARKVALTPTAERVLASIPRIPGNPWVIADARTGGHLKSLYADWHWLREGVGLEELRIHDLRHSYASRALALGESLSMIGKLLGHLDMESTARYAHLARETERAAAGRVGASIGADIAAYTRGGGPEGGEGE